MRKNTVKMCKTALLMLVCVIIVACLASVWAGLALVGAIFLLALFIGMADELSAGQIVSSSPFWCKDNQQADSHFKDELRSVLESELSGSSKVEDIIQSYNNHYTKAIKK